MVSLGTLKKKYNSKKQQLYYNREQVVEILKKKFKAKQFDHRILLDLPNDNQLNYKHIYTALSITDSKVLSSLFNEDEIKSHGEEIIDNRENPLNFKKIKKNQEQVYNHILLDEQEGRRIDIILESDGEIVTEFVIRDQSTYLNKYLNALVVGALLSKGATDTLEDLDDEDFTFYLQNLHEFGFLN
ncbi:hypothetical protein [Virgibacillus proomii]|uniref:hypothetical protein n=1 Tax=Virgibacillus proomii TaxID=84407 RepID=UPI001C110CAB|nr:hypothetical protein [Virgibacillus proomii]MBU5267588.1 hypothetical protein [Virgibacillus proomii]